MKKRIWAAILIALTAVGTACLLVAKPAFLFQSAGSLLWDAARSILLAGMLSCIAVGIAAGIVERNTLYPYIEKFIKFRPLLYQLVRRDYLAKYKRSVLGVLWSLLNPLLTMTIMTIVFSFLFRFDIENYPVYLLSGQVIYTMFNEITNQCLNSIIGSAGLIKKVSVPKYIFPLSKAISSLVNFVFSFLALILVMLFTRAPFHFSILFSIVPILYMFIFALGVGLLLSAAMVFFRDIAYLYGLLMTAVTYFTPLFYPVSIIPDRFRWVISLNPLYHMVECFRSCAIYGNIPSLWQNIVCFSLAMASLVIGLFAFGRSQDDFILYI